ncbi:MAG: hypothetical protein GY832_26205 [Chloroflexi bacterium]|nr:hypothetical protein [Chloroflexota bacterium]
MYISAWEIYKGNFSQILADAVESGKIQTTDTVWNGPSGDAIIASDPASLDEEYSEYVDGGEVGEYLD